MEHSFPDKFPLLINLSPTNIVLCYIFYLLTYFDHSIKKIGVNVLSTTPWHAIDGEGNGIGLYQWTSTNYRYRNRWLWSQLTRYFRMQFQACVMWKPVENPKTFTLSLSKERNDKKYEDAYKLKLLQDVQQTNIVWPMGWVTNGIGDQWPCDPCTFSSHWLFPCSNQCGIVDRNYWVQYCPIKSPHIE